MVEPITREWGPEWRGWVTALARGLTLELGAGDGVNIPYYPDEARVVVSEPYLEDLELARSERAKKSVSITLLCASAEELPFPDGSFDAVVGTLCFCTIPNVARALHEARRMLKPGGSLRLVEHVRAKNPVTSALMHAVNPLWHCMTGGCNIDRDTLGAVRAEGFRIVRVHHRSLGLIIGIDAVNP